MDSILLTIEQMLGLMVEAKLPDVRDTSFDVDIITGINSAFMSLNQLGVGPSECYSIKDETDEWADFLGTATNLEAVKSYIHLKVKILFDPPSNQYVFEAMERQSRELEARLALQCEPALIPDIPEEE